MTGSPTRRQLAAVVLTGGTAARLGGVDKASIEHAGTTLLERALAAVAAADEVVVVGDRRPTSRTVRWTRESPAGGGPAAGLLAGLDALTGPPDLVCVLACDMPLVTSATVARLVTAAASGLAGNDGAVLVDESSRRQTLAAVYRYAALVAARPADREAEHGLPIRRLVADLDLAGVPAEGGEARDIDTWEDLRRLG